MRLLPLPQTLVQKEVVWFSLLRSACLKEPKQIPNALDPNQSYFSKGPQTASSISVRRASTRTSPDFLPTNFTTDPAKTGRATSVVGAGALCIADAERLRGSSLWGSWGSSQTQPWWLWLCQVQARLAGSLADSSRLNPRKKRPS